jgi:outer membrane protein
MRPASRRLAPRRRHFHCGQDHCDKKERSMAVSPLSLRITAAWVLAGLAGLAGAQPAEGPAGSPADEGLAGAVILSGPRYAGADERRTRALPFVSYRWANGWFAGLESGIGYNFSGRRDLQYGLRVTGDFGREEDDSEDLRGLGDIDPALEVGAFVEQQWGAGFSVRSALRYGSGNDHKGAVLEVGAGYRWFLPTRSMLSLGLQASAANREYMQQHFGVDAQQSLNSGYAPYAPGAGLRDTRVSLGLMHPLAARWMLNAQVIAVRLGDDAADSPFVRDRSYGLGMLGVAYKF